jgi:chemotaxis protein MotB
MKKYNLLIINTLALIFLTACVSKKKFKQMEYRYVTTENALQNAKEANQELASDTAYLASQLQALDKRNDNLEEFSDYTQTTLSKKLKGLEEELTRKEYAIAGRNEFLEEQEKKLKQKEKLLGYKTKELDKLQDLIKQQNAVLDTLQNIAATALKDIDSEDMSVVVRGGKVYISFSESLLFGRSSYVIGKDGKVALKQLAEVLNNQPDIIINIEGHTDNKAVKGGSIRNNWDLSVLRAASVADVLVDNGVYAWRVVPSGRGEYSPIIENNTSENRKLNRRTEIILTPDMRPLLKLLEMRD